MSCMICTSSWVALAIARLTCIQAQKSQLEQLIDLKSPIIHEGSVGSEVPFSW